MNGALLLKAMLVGFCIAAPVGPCGLLCISRSMRGGFRSGIATGLGVTLADAIYAVLSVLGISAVVHLLEKWAFPLRVFSGVFLILLGLRIAFSRRTPNEMEEPCAQSHFASAFLVTLANPLTLFSFIAIFAGLGVVRERGTLVLGVTAGSLTWWIFLSWISASFGRRLRPGWADRATHLAGWLIVVVGLLAVLTAGWTARR